MSVTEKIEKLRKIRAKQQKASHESYARSEWTPLAEQGHAKAQNNLGARLRMESGQ